MIETRHWHPVAQSVDIARDLPLAGNLLEHPLVLWRDAAQQVHAWADQCPHRGALLSLGKVCNGQLQCGYHGWRFDATGHCVHVPALPGFVPPESHRARAYEAQERYGLVWVRLAGTPLFDPPTRPDLPAFSAETDSGLRKLICGPYDVATSAPRIVENFLDMAHFGFVHDGWLGTREATAIDDYQVQRTSTGLLATGCRAWQPRSNLHATNAAQVEYTYEVTAPYSAVLTKLPDPAHLAAPPVNEESALFRESIALFICPVAPEVSRVWFRLAMTDFASSDDKLQAFQHTIFMQDKPVLESQMPRRLPLDLRAELHTVADKASSTYRKYLRELGVTFGVS